MKRKAGVPRERRGVNSAMDHCAQAAPLPITPSHFCVRLQGGGWRRLLAWTVQMTAKAPHFAFRARCKPRPWHALHALLERIGLAA
jgi:hypothetical protein